MNTSITYQDWLKNNRDYAERNIYATEGPNCKWGRLQVEWHEVKESGEKNIHLLALSINRENGAVYLDCSKKKIYAKMLAFTLTRPLEIFIKTIYHALLPVSVSAACYQTIKEAHFNNAKMEQLANLKEQEALEIENDSKNAENAAGLRQESEDLKSKILSKYQITKLCGQAIYENLVNVIRTPIYGVAMLIVSATALIIGPFAPKRLYDFREMEETLLRSYHRVPKGNIPDTFMCFGKISTLQDQERFSKEIPGTQYPHPESKIERAMNNYAKAYVHYLRENYVYFQNPFKKLGKDEIYISPAIIDIRKKQLENDVKKLSQSTVVLSDTLFAPSFENDFPQIFQ